jgi:hypothetical protein
MMCWEGWGGVVTLGGGGGGRQTPSAYAMRHSRRRTHEMCILAYAMYIRMPCRMRCVCIACAV